MATLLGSRGTIIAFFHTTQSHKLHCCDLKLLDNVSWFLYDLEALRALWNPHLTQDSTWSPLIWVYLNRVEISKNSMKRSTIVQKPWHVKQSVT